jgi:hypothetical protein
LYWDHKRSCFANNFLEEFFFLRRKAVFREVEAEAESVFDKSYTKGALTTNGGSFNDF